MSYCEYDLEKNFLYCFHEQDNPLLQFLSKSEKFNNKLMFNDSNRFYLENDILNDGNKYIDTKLEEMLSHIQYIEDYLQKSNVHIDNINFFVEDNKNKFMSDLPNLQEHILEEPKDINISKLKSFTPAKSLYTPKISTPTPIDTPIDTPTPVDNINNVRIGSTIRTPKSLVDRDKEARLIQQEIDKVNAMRMQALKYSDKINTNNDEDLEEVKSNCKNCKSRIVQEKINQEMMLQHIIKHLSSVIKDSKLSKQDIKNARKQRYKVKKELNILSEKIKNM